MKQRIKQLIIGLTFVFGLTFALVPVTAGAVNVDPLKDVCNSGGSGAVCASKNDNVSTTIATVVNVLLFIVGSLSVIMIIVGGIMYTTSIGDATRITKAKNTLTYAIVGLAVAFLAYAIVNFVIVRFT